MRPLDFTIKTLLHCAAVGVFSSSLSCGTEVGNGEKSSIPVDPRTTNKRRQSPPPLTTPTVEPQPVAGENPEGEIRQQEPDVVIVGGPGDTGTVSKDGVVDAIMPTTNPLNQDAPPPKDDVPTTTVVSPSAADASELLRYAFSPCANPFASGATSEQFAVDGGSFFVKMDVAVGGSRSIFLGGALYATIASGNSFGPDGKAIWPAALTCAGPISGFEAGANTSTVKVMVNGASESILVSWNVGQDGAVDNIVIERGSKKLLLTRGK